MHVWYYIDSPGTSNDGYFASVPLTGQVANSSIWRYTDWTIPANWTIGGHSYYAGVWQWNGSSWIPLGAMTGPQNFLVAPLDQADVAADMPAPLDTRSFPAPTRAPKGQ